GGEAGKGAIDGRPGAGEVAEVGPVALLGAFAVSVAAARAGDGHGVGANLPADEAALEARLVADPHGCIGSTQLGQDEDVLLQVDGPARGEELDVPRPPVGGGADIAPIPNAHIARDVDARWTLRNEADLLPEADSAETIRPALQSHGRAVLHAKKTVRTG